MCESSVNAVTYIKKYSGSTLAPDLQRGLMDLFQTNNCALLIDVWGYLGNNLNLNLTNKV